MLSCREHSGVERRTRGVRERIVQMAAANTVGSGPDVIDADHIRIHLCVNSAYPVEPVNRGDSPP